PCPDYPACPFVDTPRGASCTTSSRFARAGAGNGNATSSGPGGIVMRIFRSEIETALKIMGIAALISLILLPVAWGYEQRQRARQAVKSSRGHPAARVGGRGRRAGLAVRPLEHQRPEPLGERRRDGKARATPRLGLARADGERQPRVEQGHEPPPHVAVALHE